MALELRVTGEQRRINLQGLFAINAHPLLFSPFGLSTGGLRFLLTMPAFPVFFRRIIPVLGSSIGFDVRLAFFAFEPRDFITQSLILLLRLAQVRTQTLDQVEQPNNQLLRLLILDLAQIASFKHDVPCLSRDCVAAWLLCYML